MPTLARDFEVEPWARGAARWANPNGGDAAFGVCIAADRTCGCYSSSQLLLTGLHHPRSEVCPSGDFGCLLFRFVCERKNPLGSMPAALSSSTKRL